MNTLVLWIEIVGGPILWLVYLQVNYVLVPSACVAENKQSRAVALLITLAASIVVMLLSWQSWRRAGPNSATEEGSATGRSRFMALSGLGISALSVLLVLSSAIPIFFLGACD